VAVVEGKFDAPLAVELVAAPAAELVGGLVGALAVEPVAELAAKPEAVANIQCRRYSYRYQCTCLLPRARRSH
jgi:hypothetical protein